MGSVCAGCVSTVEDYIKFLEALRIGDMIMKKFFAVTLAVLAIMSVLALPAFAGEAEVALAMTSYMLRALGATDEQVLRERDENYRRLFGDADKSIS